MKQALLAMLDLQDSMNSKVNLDWKNQGNAWYRAIWIECAELLDHYGWKWWKQQIPDQEQVNLELIDIWHFGLSIRLEESADLTDGSVEPLHTIVNQIEEDFLKPYIYHDFRESIEDFALSTLQSKSFDIPKFAGLLNIAGLSFEALYSGYVGKNVLNFFRQDNGYKNGTYRKIWQGKEDNEHLVETLKSLNSDSSTFQKDIYQALEERYRMT